LVFLIHTDKTFCVELGVAVLCTRWHCPSGVGAVEFVGCAVTYSD